MSSTCKSGFWFFAACIFCLIGWVGTAAGQDQPGEPAAADATREALQAVAIEVQGDVRQAPVGVSATGADGWKAVKVNDQIAAGTQIKTGFRSYVNLMFGDDTVFKVEKMTVASIDDYYKTATTKSVRLGLGYGAVRGGSTEGELRSDVVVRSTVATLAKRGTEGMRLECEPTTGQFHASLSRSGLSDVLSLLTGERRTLHPHEYATARNIMNMWVNQDVFDRACKFWPRYGVTDDDAMSTASNTTGTTVTGPSASTETNDTAGRYDPNFVGGVMAGRGEQPPLLGSFGPVQRPEGDFGLPPTLGGLFLLPPLPKASPNVAPRSSWRFNRQTERAARAHQAVRR